MTSESKRIDDSLSLSFSPISVLVFIITIIIIFRFPFVSMGVCNFCSSICPLLAIKFRLHLIYPLFHFIRVGRWNWQRHTVTYHRVPVPKSSSALHPLSGAKTIFQFCQFPSSNPSASSNFFDSHRQLELGNKSYLKIKKKKNNFSNCNWKSIKNLTVQKARMARIRIAKATSGAAFVNKKKATEARLAAFESGLELEDLNEDIFELQHHHLLRCLEKATVSTMTHNSFIVIRSLTWCLIFCRRIGNLSS